MRLALLALLVLAGCDLLDPTEVDNPRTTIDDLADSPRPTQALLPGLRAAFAGALGDVVTLSAVVSDDYSVHNSGLSAELDEPRRITPRNETLNTTGGAYFGLQSLRALADFVLEDVAPDDETATPALRAEARYYRGVALLMMGETFAAAPLVEDGAPVAAPALLERAVADLEAALDLDPAGPFALASEAALARAHRDLGDAAAMADYAQRALARDEAFVVLRPYDPVTVTNPPFAFLVARSLQELQPLPRLDFLDPKYTTPDAAVPVAKAEEMHLLLAEAALEAGDPERARDRLAQAAELARSGRGPRTTATFQETDVRNGAGGVIRPRDAAIRVRADAQSPFVDGLVLQRPGTVAVPAVSFTSVSADSVAAVDAGSLLRLLYALRQEVLFLEGRRHHDLGLRLPMMQREIDTNPTIAEGDAGTRVVVPDWVPAGGAMDRFDPPSPYDRRERLATTEITIEVDMNRVLAARRGPVVSAPFPGL